MKKVIAAAAGLMLVGAMVGTASAAVSLDGDARARGYYQSNYDFGRMTDGKRTNEIENSFSSRVRVRFVATSKGGAYARARVRMADSTWDGTKGTRNKGAGSNSYIDYAYIGVPMGPVVLEAGMKQVNLTKFTYWDRSNDLLHLIWKNDMTTVQGWYAKAAEFTDADTDFIDDNDVDNWVLAWTQKFAGDFGMTIAGAYVNDETPVDGSGGWATINVGGPAGPVSLEAELAYKSSDLLPGDDNGYGAFINAGFDLGAAAVTVSAGATKDGFVADDDFGWIMVGGAASITPGITAEIGDMGDTWWLYAVSSFQVSESLKLKGILGYSDIKDIANMTEISGSLVYQISDGANFQWDIGYLSISGTDASNITTDPFGTAGTFNVSF